MTLLGLGHSTSWISQKFRGENIFSFTTMYIPGDPWCICICIRVHKQIHVHVYLMQWQEHVATILQPPPTSNSLTLTLPCLLQTLFLRIHTVLLPWTSTPVLTLLGWLGLGWHHHRTGSLPPLTSCLLPLNLFNIHIHRGLIMSHTHKTLFV